MSSSNERNSTIEEARDYLLTGALNGFTAEFGIGQNSNAVRYKLGPHDEDWRGSGKTFNEALDEAFKNTGVERNKFKPTKWAKNEYGKSIPVEYEGPGGAKVSVDYAYEGEAPDAPHVG